jgi:pyruvate dehydrogenase E1 component alpha subunit
LRTFLSEADLWDEAADIELRERILAEIDEAFFEAERLAADRTPAMLFEHVYADPPPHLRAQQAEIEKEASLWLS